MESRKRTLYPKSLLSPPLPPLSPPRCIEKYRKSTLAPYRRRVWWEGLDYVGRTLPDILSPVKKIFNMDD